jgi:hypothetical protein
MAAVIPIIPMESWSFSKLSDFERCKGYTKLKHIDRIPEPERPLPPGKTEHANDRGSRIHDAAEKYVNGTGSFVGELGKFEAEFRHMRSLYASGVVSLEGEWGMDNQWEPTGWNGQWVDAGLDDGGYDLTGTFPVLPDRGRTGDTVKVAKHVFYWDPSWLRLKLDAMVEISPTEAVVIDYKTGRSFGNEVKHGQQVQLYTVVAFMKFPLLEKVTTELWYLDQDELTSMSFTRAQGLRFKATFDKRGNALTSAVDFPFSPSIHACRWCAYGDSGDCLVSAKGMFPHKKR